MQIHLHDGTTIVKRQYGNRSLYELEGVEYFNPPFQTRPTQGEKHKIDQCKDCKEAIAKARKILMEQFAGDGKNLPFPMCCAGHKKLAAKHYFNRSDFEKTPQWTAEKLAFMKNHIINNIDSPQYLEEITDYLEYTIESFGQTPKGCGEPLFYSFFIDNLIRYLKNEKKLPREKVMQILEHIDKAHTSASTPEKPDFEETIDVYSKWLKIFPFEFGAFSELKEGFYSVLPFIGPQKRMNKYLNRSVYKMQTKAELYELLKNTTQRLLSNFSGDKYIDEFEMKDWDKRSLNAIIQKRKQGLLETENVRLLDFNRKIKLWLNHEVEFANDMRKLLSSAQEAEPLATAMRNALQPLGFESIDKVRNLKAESRLQLFKRLSKEKVAYQIAMLDYLGFINCLETKYRTKTKLHKELGTALGCDERTIRGNINALNVNSKEDPRYNSLEFKELVEKDYQNMISGQMP